MVAKTKVYVETGSKRVIASAADWPGWCRGGKDEALALEALAAYAPRYARVLKMGQGSIPSNPSFEVVERIPGSATTDYGVPGFPAKNERRTPAPAEVARLCGLVETCWRYFDHVTAGAPEALRKGPRGGGRDRDKIVEHVLGAESEYGKAIGIRQKMPAISDVAGIKAFRKAILDAMSAGAAGEKWPVAYFARRAGWHVLDHAWEIEDRIP